MSHADAEPALNRQLYKLMEEELELENRSATEPSPRTSVNLISVKRCIIELASLLADDVTPSNATRLKAIALVIKRRDELKELEAQFPA